MKAGKMKFVLLLVHFIPTIICSKDASIIIIGAGPSGISAATKLLENNFTEVKLFEAESRIGGRIRSVKFGDGFIDLGAEWCHGQQDNIVYDLVKDLNILKSDPMDEEFYTSSRTVFRENFTENLFEKIFAIYPEFVITGKEATVNTTLGDYCIDKFNSTVPETFKSNETELKVAQSSVVLFQHIVNSYEGSFTWFDPAAVSDFEDSGGDSHLSWNGNGFKTVLDVLMKKYPDPSQSLPIDDKILLNKEVTKIIYDKTAKKNGVTVQCADQSSYVADHVIFTPSIGVLKHQAQKIFEPKLPAYKNDAIENIGFGAVMKIAILYENPWWKDSNGFILLWENQDITDAKKKYPDGPNINGRSWVTYIFSAAKAPNNSKVILIWITGDAVPVVEKLSQDALLKGINFVFKKFLGHVFEINEPDAVLRSTWHTNPHFRGSYSFQTVHSKRKTFNDTTNSEEDLAAPIISNSGSPILMFAGEATNPRHFSTVHGAIETGHREANRIIKLYE